MFIAYTVKGYGLPFAGHKDNHAGLMNPGADRGAAARMGIAEGDEWQPFAGLGDNAAAAMQAFIAGVGHRPPRARRCRRSSRRPPPPHS